VNDPNRIHTLSAVDVVLRTAIVALALGTASIHFRLGGPLFTLNGLGYVAGATAMIIPLTIVRRHRWLVRIGLAAFTVTTIVAWAVQGPFYPVAYLAKAIEVSLITLLAIDFARRDGNPIDRIRDELRSFLGRPQGRATHRP